MTQDRRRWWRRKVWPIVWEGVLGTIIVGIIIVIFAVMGQDTSRKCLKLGDALPLAGDCWPIRDPKGN